MELKDDKLKALLQQTRDEVIILDGIERLYTPRMA